MPIRMTTPEARIQRRFTIVTTLLLIALAVSLFAAGHSAGF